ncbi:MAG: VTT domain-containing protein [Thermoanaerobaculia bacterium]
MNELTTLILRYGVGFVFLNVLVEQLGIPVPAVPTLLVAGALAADGKLQFGTLLAAVMVATVAADTVWFLLGRRYGQKVLKTLCRVSLSPDSCVRQTEGLFDTYGLASLLFAKFIPGYSTVAPPLAGAAGAPLPRFLLFTAGGTLLWSGSALALGVLFHGAIERALSFLANLGGGALVLLGAALVLYIAVKWTQRRRFYKFLRMARIRAADLRRLMDEGKAPLIVDVRSHNARARDPRRIPGAIVVDILQLDEKISHLPTDREIVLYCT